MLLCRVWVWFCCYCGCLVSCLSGGNCLCFLMCVCKGWIVIGCCCLVMVLSYILCGG